MGRTLKRVPLDFDWPLNEIWKGYLNPYYKNMDDCEDCDKTGLAPDALKLYRQWYGSSYPGSGFTPKLTGSKPFAPGDPDVQKMAERNAKGMIDAGYLDPRMRDIYLQQEAIRLADLFNASWSHHIDEDDVAALVADGRLLDFTHTWSKEDGWVRREDEYIPTAEEVNRWSIKGMGHDSINHHVCVRAKSERLGFEVTCPVCGGEGHLWDSKESERKFEEWKSYEPPKGEGFQLWETTSEGSPVSPVFETLEDLCEWCEDNATTFADYKTSKEKWMEMLGKDFVHVRMHNQETNTGIILI